jgi:hypothetical protein
MGLSVGQALNTLPSTYASDGGGKSAKTAKSMQLWGPMTDFATQVCQLTGFWQLRERELPDYPANH